ncbi:hypothetical protein N9V38_02160 [Planktomarina temperata]|nr:hypothetical protein [Planktomarina temperata]
MKIIIFKTGALGDVLRTSYFAKYLRMTNRYTKIDWLTDKTALPLIRHNPYIDTVYTQNTFSVSNYDRIYSLDDEKNIVELTKGVPPENITGAYFHKDQLTYTRDSADWFDMGLISELGKTTADAMKKTNTKSHIEIFENIFDVKKVRPNSNLNCQRDANKYRQVCITPAAGKRWPSKSLLEKELLKLIQLIANQGKSIKIVGTEVDFLQYNTAMQNFPDLFAIVDSIQELSNEIYNSGTHITADTLSLHIGQSLGKKMVSFFAPTSAAEIPSIQNIKICSTARDYCSYSANANNETITADRIYNALNHYI